MMPKGLLEKLSDKLSISDWVPKFAFYRTTEAIQAAPRIEVAPKRASIVKSTPSKSDLIEFLYK